MTSVFIDNLVHQITYLPKERKDLLRRLPLDQQAKVLLRLSTSVQRQVLKQIPKELLLPLLTYLDPDDATDLLQLMPKKRQQELMAELSESLQQDISLLLQFDPKTAAGLMSLNYIQVDAAHGMSDVIKSIKKHEQRTGKFPIVLVMERGRLLGYIPSHKLAFADPSQSVKNYIRAIPVLPHTTDYQGVVDHFLERPHSKTAVLGANGAILGILYSDDVLNAIREQEASTLYDFAGVREEETVFDTAKNKFRSRYKWLILNLATAFMASFTVGLFGDTISKYVLLAVYMPIVAGMGGNSATQTLAVLVRGISLNQITLKTCLPTLQKELGAALLNGVLNGLLVAGIVILFNRDYLLAAVLAIAMILNLLVAGFFGTLVPLIMARLGKDPAASATIFITTATDVLGFMAFLGLATVLLQ